MSDWYYAEGGDPNGPHSEEDIRSLLLVEALNAESLLWRDGMAGWTPVLDLPEFADAAPRKMTPPPIPVTRPPITMRESRRAPVSDELAAAAATPPERKPEGWGEPINMPAPERHELTSNSPWSRYFARSLDLTITSTVAGFIVGYVLAYWAPHLYLQLVSQQAQLQNIILLPVALVINGIVAGIFGTTLGKKVMALRFIYLNGRLGLVGQIVRELKVWVQGLAFGIPIVSIFTGVSQYRRVTAGQPASYDAGIVLVKQDDIPEWRRALGMIFCALVFVGGIAWSVWPENSASSSSPSLAASVSIQWTNPVTGESVQLPPGWTASAQDNGQGATVYVFNFADGTKQAVLGAEDEVAGVTDALTYGRALKVGLAGMMTLGEFAQTLTPGVLRADGTYDSEGWRASVLVTKVGSRFWRIVSIDTAATGGDVTVPAMATALWNSTN